ncbi:MAG: hypothetical protein IJK86_08185 [Lachnospiraceae bacterium]|nr:hypothetical protein [Lachnospiraceae bacterium]
MQTFFYSILHFMTDGLCAFALYSRFAGKERWALYILIYDFCAFVLQMPFGALVDAMKVRLPEKAAKLPFLCALSGAVLTAAGAFLHPAVLGVGNALFHVGGGIGTITEDRENRLEGAALGIFVAPGAMGLYLGTVIGQLHDGVWNRRALLVIAAVYLLLFLVFGLVAGRREREAEGAGKRDRDTVSVPLRKTAGPAAAAAALCFLVVVLRSYAGFSVVFSWKTGFRAGFVCTLAVVLGKMAGGLLAARFGAERVMTVSLILSALGYLFSNVPAAGVAALFFFNMTMPVTLYLIADRFRGLEGFSFGLLTVALFLGVLPTFFGAPALLPGRWLGAAVSLLSLLMLLASVRLLEKERRWKS